MRSLVAMSNIGKNYLVSRDILENKHYFKSVGCDNLYKYTIYNDLLFRIMKDNWEKNGLNCNKIKEIDQLYHHQVTRINMHVYLKILMFSMLDYLKRREEHEVRVPYAIKSCFQITSNTLKENYARKITTRQMSWWNLSKIIVNNQNDARK